MNTPSTLGHYIQIGSHDTIKPIRIKQFQENNTYTANFTELDSSQNITVKGDAIEVINIAEPSNQSGKLSANTDALAVEVDGFWIVHIPLSSPATTIAKIVSHISAEKYTLRLQELDANLAFTDIAGTADFEASNLAEISLGPGGGVDINTIVLVSTLISSNASERVIFSHPVYAKYLD